FAPGREAHRGPRPGRSAQGPARHWPCVLPRRPRRLRPAGHRIPALPPAHAGVVKPMFTGIVTDIGEVVAVSPRCEGLRRLKVACRYERASIVEGASIACSGVCMTVVGAGEEKGRTWFAVDAAAETLRVSAVGRWREGTRINLERPLKVGDELGGHIV